MVYDLINFGKLRTAGKYICLILIMLGLQDIFFARLTFFGVKLMFVPALAAAIGLFEGSVWGGFMGMFCGFISDLCFSESTVMFMILFTLIGFASGMAAHFYVNRKFFSYAFICTAALLFTGLVQMVRPVVFYGADFIGALYVVILQAAVSLPFGLLTFFPCRAISDGSKKR